MTGLRGLSDVALLAGLRRWVGESRAATAQVVAHLAEVERRELHLKAGFSSMFRYVTEGLGFSEGAAYRRIQVARLSRRVPQLLGLIGSGRLHLAGAALLGRVITAENRGALLEAACGQSKRAIEALVAAQSPRPAVPDRVRRLPAAAGERRAVGAPLIPGLAPDGAGVAARSDTGREGVAQAGGTNAPGGNGAAAGASREGQVAPVGAAGDLKDGGSACGLGRRGDARVEGRTLEGTVGAGGRRGFSGREGGGAGHPIPLGRDRYKVVFTASPRTVARLEQARALLSHRLPGGDLDALFGQALSLLCEKLEKERFGRGAKPAARRERSGNCVQQSENTTQATLPGGDGSPRIRFMTADCGGA